MTSLPAVLIVHNRYRQAGGEDAVVQAEATLLADRGHRVERLIVDNSDIADDLGAGGKIRLAVETVWSPRAASRVKAAATALGADVVHIHNFLPQLSPAIHGAARRTGAAVVQTLHNYRLICPAATLLRDGRPCQDCRSLPIALPAIVHACYRESRAQSATVTAMLAVHRLRRTWTRDVDEFIALGAFAADRLSVGGLPRDRILLKPNFIADTPPPPTGPRAGFLFVGRLSHEKGIEVLLEAWRQANLPTTLRVVGDGPLADKVAAAAAADPRIIAMGRLDGPAVHAEMTTARALAFPSTWFEGMPVTILEAFSSGIPVIASAHGSLADLVHDGVSGLHVTPGSPESLAAALARLDADVGLAATLGRGARMEYETHYTAATNYVRLIEIYEAAMAHRRTAAKPARA